MISARTSEKLTRVFTLMFVLMFFAYLFGPLIVMGMSAFNTSSFPRISPWDCFTVEWFDVLVNDTDLMTGLKNSVTIAVGVVLFAVPLGLAGALMLTQVSSRIRPWYYTVVISPILIPGVVLGISTLVFWDRMGRMFNAGYDSFFYDGIFLTIVGQSTFVAAYAMLIFISRLQRFDSVQEEAALDLGATHVQTFRKILLPFLKPAIGSACVLGFLASFENYNTTIFTIVSKSTLTTVLASKVRYGINPSISALAVIIICLTLIGAIYFEILKRREERYERDIEQLVKTGSTDRAKKASLLTNPAIIMVTVIFIAGLGTVYFAGTIGVNECKAEISAQKARETQRKVDEFKKKRMFKNAAPSQETSSDAGVTSEQPEVEATGTKGYGSIFAPSNLEEQVDSEKTE
ncbi:MAG: ABC transporter permease [Gammaproteobacteria bacterium]|nr:ABC transporter permease [Gammaproteobacteria bacterium]